MYVTVSPCFLVADDARGISVLGAFEADDSAAGVTIAGFGFWNNR